MLLSAMNRVAQKDASSRTQHGVFAASYSYQKRLISAGFSDFLDRFRIACVKQRRQFVCDSPCRPTRFIHEARTPAASRIFAGALDRRSLNRLTAKRLGPGAHLSPHAAALAIARGESRTAFVNYLTARIPARRISSCRIDGGGRAPVVSSRRFPARVRSDVAFYGTAFAVFLACLR